MSMPERDTMHLRNKKVFGVFGFILLGAGAFWGAQSPATQPAQNQQKIQPTPLPSDIDPSDPALPDATVGDSRIQGAPSVDRDGAGPQ